MIHIDNNESIPDRKPDPAPTKMIDWRELGPKVEAVKRLASKNMTGPTSLQVNLWEDGEAKVMAFHSSHGLKTVIQYHTSDGEVIGGIHCRDTEEVYHKERITNLGAIEPPASGPEEV